MDKDSGDRAHPWKERTEEIEVAAGELLERITELIREGNVRRIIIRKSNGELLLEMPLSAGVVVGGVLAIYTPVIAALAAMAALLSHFRIEVVRCAPEEEESCREEHTRDTGQVGEEEPPAP